MTFRKIYTGLFKKFLDIFWPPVCSICFERTGGDPVCPECVGSMKINLRPHCPECGAIAESPCNNHPKPLFDNYYPLYDFGDVVRDLIHKLKYSGRRDIGEFFGFAMAEKMAGNIAFSDVDALVPVPLHPVKKRERGYNQSEIIAESIGKTLGIPVLQNGVKRIRQTESQTKLNHEERKQNISNAFKPMRDLTGKNCVIIDDVITTGSTTNELAQAISIGGGTVKCAICVAHPEASQSKEYSI